MLRLVARFVAVLCAIAFVFLTVGVLFFQAAGTRCLQAPIYKHALARERIYERFPGLAADALLARRARASRLRSRVAGTAQDAFDLLAQLNPADWERLLGAVAPASYLRA
jgi:hypothetical protein